MAPLKKRITFGQNSKATTAFFIATYSALYMLFIIAIFTLGFYYYKKIVTEEEGKLYRMIGSLVVESISKVSFSGRHHSQLLIDDFVRNNKDIEYIVITDKKEETVASSGLKGKTFKTEHTHDSLIGLNMTTKTLVDGNKTTLINELQFPYFGGYPKEKLGLVSVGISVQKLEDNLKEGLLTFIILFAAVLPMGLYIIFFIGKKYGEPIRRLAYKFEGVLEYSPLLVAFYDRHGDIKEASRVFIEFFEIDDAAYSQNIYESMERLGIQNFELDEREIFDEGFLRKTDIIFEKDNEVKKMQMLQFLVSESDVDEYIVGVILNDITRLAQRENELSELNKTLEARIEEELKKNRQKDDIVIRQSRLIAMGEMSSNIAHNWRQPLTIIGAVFLNIEESFEDGELDSEYLKKELLIGNKTLEKLSKTIDDFRDFFKPRGHKVKFMVRKEVEKAIRMIESNLKSHNIELVLDRCCDCSILGYSNEFSQVVLNILSNARDVLVERNTPNAVITIRIYDVEDKCMVDIGDNAGGVPEGDEEKIFEPYYTTKSPESGSGLGLFMSKSLIEKNMNGTLQYIKDGEKSIFRIEV